MNTIRPPRSGKIPYSLILIAALAAGLGLWLGQGYFPVSQPPQTQNLRLLDPPRTLPAFALEGADGTTLDVARLRGHYTLLFLGFTHCPDVCPTTLQDLARAEKLWADLPEAQRPRILFVSVDPERDTPETLAKYVAYFSTDMLAATGNIDALHQLASSLNFVFAKVPLDNGDYSIDHTSWIAVLDPEVNLVGFIPPPLDAATIASDIKLLMKSR